jgi:hypothetical protein
MNKFNICQHCGLESSKDEDFQTDIDACLDSEEMTCESCYDDFNK